MSKRDAPATHRNRDAILTVLRHWLDTPVRVLEIASGTGQHAVFFASELPHVHWQPSDADPVGIESIEGWVADSALPNVSPPILLNASSPAWPEIPFDVVFNANMIHIAPWNVAEGLFAGVSRGLPKDGLFFLYGPFRMGAEHTAPSNAAFDADLRLRDPSWGVRDLELVEALGEASGLELVEKSQMPANNWMLVFQRRSRD